MTPILGTELAPGTGSFITLAAQPPVAHTIDGNPSDWAGTPSPYAGVTVPSAGELIYTDHLFDAYGADDGKDAQRLATLDPLYSNVPESYRLDPILQNDPPGQVGAPEPGAIQYHTNYGDLPEQDAADLTELRIAPDGDGIDVLARVATMRTAADTELLLLLETQPGSTTRAVGYGTGLHTTRAELAVLVTGSGATITDLRTGATTQAPAAADPSGWTNALEAHIPLSENPTAIAAATRETGQPIANVAFRADEPVREYFDKQQALDLLAGTIDRFFEPLDLQALRAGANERYVPGPGYHEKIFTSTDQISRESGEDGILQPYGVFLPSSYKPGVPAPLQLWLHWRGGDANSAANVDPGIFRDMGEAYGTIVVSPRGRGSSSWYVGRGQVDLEQVWADVHSTFAIDRAHTYVAGHSMGGWGTYLETIVHPDWFAAGLPASGPVTQGAWTGVDVPGCDMYTYDDYSPCYVQANGGDARAEHTRRMLENLRHVPLALYTGMADELVPFSGVARQVQRLVELGYVHRWYVFEEQEHFGPPVWDQWAEGAAYEHSFAIDANPAEVTYKRDMTFEHAIDTVNSGGATLDFGFDHAYWMSGLTPKDAVAGVASFDGRSLAIPERAQLTAPEAGGPASPGQTGPWTMTGLKKLNDPLSALPAARNAFTATLSGATAVTLDTARMRLDPRKPLVATVTTDTPVDVTLTGWGRTVRFQTGTHSVTI